MINTEISDNVGSEVNMMFVALTELGRLASSDSPHFTS